VEAFGAGSAAAARPAPRTAAALASHWRREVGSVNMALLLRKRILECPLAAKKSFASLVGRAFLPGRPARAEMPVPHRETTAPQGCQPGLMMPWDRAVCK